MIEPTARPFATIVVLSALAVGPACDDSRLLEIPDIEVELEGDDPSRSVVMRATMSAVRCTGSHENDDVQCTPVRGLDFDVVTGGVVVTLDEHEPGLYKGELLSTLGPVELRGPWRPRVCEPRGYYRATPEAVSGGMTVVIDPASVARELRAEIRDSEGNLHDYVGFDGARLNKVVPVGMGMSVLLERVDVSLFDDEPEGPIGCDLHVLRTVTIP